MEPVDAVKLVYQSEFGCGHLLLAEAGCAESVRRELEQTPVRDEPPAVAVGGGLCRLNLAAPSVRSLSPESVARMMRLTAARAHGGTASFEQGLEMLRALAREGAAPFSPEALDRYLEEYRAKGTPPVSHSQRYREAYGPAYRVVLEDFAPLVPVIAAADGRLAREGRVTVALDGPCGAGKTTLGDLLALFYGVNPIRMDDFFLPPNLRTPQRLREPGGNVHYERFAREVIAGLEAGGGLAYRRFDCGTGRYHMQKRNASAVAVIEGSYSHHPYFDRGYDKLNALRVFVGVEAGEQLRRLSGRNPEKLERFRSEWIPLEKCYFEAYDIRERADIALESRPWEDEV